MSCRFQKTKICNGKPGFEAVYPVSSSSVSSVFLSQTRQTHFFSFPTEIHSSWPVWEKWLVVVKGLDWTNVPVGSLYLLGVSTCWESLPVGFHVKSLLTLRDQFLEDGVTWNKLCGICMYDHTCIHCPNQAAEACIAQVTNAGHSSQTYFQWRPSPRKWSNHLASSVPPTHTCYIILLCLWPMR